MRERDTESTATRNMDRRVVRLLRKAQVAQITVYLNTTSDFLVQYVIRTGRIWGVNRLH